MSGLTAATSSPSLAAPRIVDAYPSNTSLQLSCNVVPYLSDASSNALVLTATGSPTASSFSPFNDGYYGLTFSGTATTMSNTTASSALVFSGDYTVEGWFYLSYSAGRLRAWEFSDNNDNVEIGGGTINMFIAGTGFSGTAPSTGWVHIALTRASNTYRLFANGTQVATTTGSTVAANRRIYIGGNSNTWFAGTVSNFRIVNGTALYTSAFTPSTTPLTAITNTVLLTARSNTVIDISTSALPLTYTGGGVTPLNPFVMPNSAALTGSSYFNGSSYLTVQSSTALGFGTGDFTIECWFNAAAYASNTIWDQRALGGAASQAKPLIYLVGNTLNYWVLGSSRISVTPTLNAWNHVSVCRASSVTKMYLNGILAGTWADTTDYGSSSDAVIGVLGDVRNAGYFSGYLSNVRVIKGTALYTTNFTPSTVPLTNIANTSLLTLQTAQNYLNTAIQDSSNCNNSMTATGTPTQGSFSPFGNGGYSVLCAGTSGSYISPTYSAVLDQTGDFTYEGWFYYVTMPTAGYQNVIGQGNIGTNQSAGLYVANAAANTWSAPYKLKVTAANVGDQITGTTEIFAKKWYHFALVRISNVAKLYVNGVQEGGNWAYSTSQVFNSTYSVWVGQYSNAYFSNVRYIKGTGLYTSNFTVPTAPLTPITNTSLLICQSPLLKDASTNHLTITGVGSPVVSPIGPFVGRPASGSMLFNGTTDYLTSPYNSAMSVNGAMSFECWVYATATTDYIIACRNWGYGGGGPTWGFRLTNSITPNWGIAGTGASTYVLTQSTVSGALNTWTHYVFSRDASGVGRVFVNGVLGGSQTYTAAMSDTTSSLYVGVSTNLASPKANGYMSGMRLVVGSVPAEYATTSTTTGAVIFNVPTSPPTQTADTVLLLNFSGAGAVDVTSSTNMSSSVVSIQNGVRKYNLGSYAFNGSTSYISIPDQTSINFGAGDFTIEFWMNPSQIASSVYVAGHNTTGKPWLIHQNGATMTFYASADGTNWLINAVTFGTVAAGSWYHVAIARQSTNVRLFLNGALGNTAAISTSSLFAPSAPMTVGQVGGSYFNGYIDDFRITKGQARYTAAFTPPTRIVAI